MWALRWNLAAIALAVVATVACAQDQIHWQSSVESARQIAASTNRLVLVHFWSTSCKPCMRLEKEVFSRADVAKTLDANYVMVKLNVDEAPASARVYGVASIPADVVISPSGQLISQTVSPPTAAQYLAQMGRVATGYRNLTGQSQPQVVTQQPPAPSVAGPPIEPATVVNPVMADPGQSNSVYANERYAEYYRRRQIAPLSNAPAPNAQSQANVTAQATAAGPEPSAVQLAQGAMAGPPRVDPSQLQNHAAQAAAPPGLDGYCPVTLLERRGWAKGNPAYGVVHRGRTYLFAGPEQANKFFANPDYYCPVLSGNDPVLALDNQVAMPGRREFGVFAQNRVYLFAGEESRRRFEQNPNRYAPEALQAMR